MFDISPMLNQPFGTFVSVKNAREYTIDEVNKLIEKGMKGEDLTDKERMIIGSYVKSNDKINQRGKDSEADKKRK